MLDNATDNDRHYLEGGKLVIYTRSGIYQARVYKGDRRYVTKSLKTEKLAEAKKLGLRFLHEIEYKQAEGLPIKQVTMSQVLDEYLALRQQEYDRVQAAKQQAGSKTISIYMIRQIKRVSKFWHAYCGKTAISKVDNKLMQEYVSWRKAYYHNMPADQRPRNFKLNPKDKTLEWEVILGKTVLKFAHERGYRGKTQLPTYSFTAATKIVRPAFLITEYRVLYKEMRKWIYEAKNAREKHPRLLLRDYVLILSNSGMRIGEANNLKWRDVIEFKDERGRKNYMLNVKGKTGKRTVIPRTNAVRPIERLAERYPNKTGDDYVFRMKDGSQVISLIDQFLVVLGRANILENTHGERYTLYSLRHFYAVQMLRKGVGVFDIARNMGTSVQMIEMYYGRQATPIALATKLGG